MTNKENPTTQQCEIAEIRQQMCFKSHSGWEGLAGIVRVIYGKLIIGVPHVTGCYHEPPPLPSMNDVDLCLGVLTSRELPEVSV